MPLAVRCDTRIWISHSLPSDRLTDKFDREILDRQLEAEDLEKPGSAYLLTWGRNHSQSLIDKMAELFGGRKIDGLAKKYGDGEVHILELK